MTTKVKDELTPLMKQYWKIKAANPDSILLYRMGDFYETFAEDAKITSKILGITLTARGKDEKGSKIALAGFPWHSLDTYLHKLVKSGYKVAICEQVEDPSLSKGIVKREVVEIVTPGTTLSDKMLEDGKNNFIASICVYDNEVGLSWADASTGAFSVSEVDKMALGERLRSIEPSEILIQQSDEDGEENLLNGMSAMVTPLEDWIFSNDYAYERLTEQFKTKNLKGFGMEKLTVGIKSAGALLHYLEQNHKESLRHFTTITVHNEDSFMGLDQTTVRNLELFEPMMRGTEQSSLLDVINRTKTAMGSRLLRNWLRNPLTEISDIEKRLEVVSFFSSKSNLRDETREHLGSMNDIERLLSRLSSGRAMPRDLVALRESLIHIPELKLLLNSVNNKELKSLISQSTDLSKLTELIKSALNDEPPATKTDGGYIRDGYNEQLDELRSISSSGKDWIASMQAKERERLGIPSLKIGYNRVFGYYLEVTKMHINKVPEDFIRKQTLVNSERYITPELKEYEEKVLGAEEKIKALELKLFDEILDKVLDSAGEIQWNADVIARLDVLSTFGLTAESEEWTRPVLEESTRISIKDGRHPVVEELLPPGESFVPNDLEADCHDRQIHLVTGPNMAGKSTYLRQIAIIVLLAQIGSYVPASEVKMGIVDKLFTRVGASDNLAGGESTFLVEMNETANILNNATERSLILLDEIGRGTSTYDGLSIAWSVTEYLHNNPKVAAKTLFATHYHELAELAELLPRVHNLNVAVKEYGDKIVFLRKIIPGSSDHSYGIQVAQLAGLPRSVIERAKEVLWSLEKEYSSLQKQSVKKESVSEYQIGIFDEKEAKLKDELKELDLNSMTPLEAMAKLDELKKKWGLEN
ncbi:MAG: DNA mismatch repair protein MutS [Candidatus Marinimicrobia bacterium]|nr:DNA mismatch repair protein MutS [Candidatus Neomarinimicrobiota bacterium]